MSGDKKKFRSRRDWTEVEWERYYSLTAEAHHAVVEEFQSVQAEAHAMNLGDILEDWPRHDNNEE